MSRFFSSKYKNLTPYTPGEQPKERKYIKLNTNESPFPPSPLAQRLAREKAGEIELYSDPECTALKNAAAEKWGISSDRIVFTNGSDEILNFAFMAFCDSEHPVIFPDITYGFYPVFAALNNVPYETIPLGDDFTVDPADYIGKGKNIFIANPNAPTGIALPLSDIEKIVASNPDNIVVIDEAYVDFGGESAVVLTEKYDNIIVTGTFSKSRSLAGGRLGFGIACPEIIRDIETIRYSTNPYNINSLTMAAGVGAIYDSEYFENNCNTIIKTREKTAKALEEAGFTVLPSKTNFIFVRHPGVSGDDIYRELRERGILVRHFTAERIKEFNRITIGSERDMVTLTEALREITEGK